MSLNPKTVRASAQRIAQAIEAAALTVGLSGLVQARAHFLEQEDRAERRGRSSDRRKHLRRLERLDELIDEQLHVVHDREDQDRERR